MSDNEKTSDVMDIDRRKLIKAGATAIVASFTGGFMSIVNASAHRHVSQPKNQGQKAFAYTELQLSKPFREVPWQAINREQLQQPGLLNTTWFAGDGNNSVGGFHAFDSVENAQQFVTDYYPVKAKQLGAPQASRIFNAAVVEEASRDLRSPHFGFTLRQNPGALVYTEVQVSVPFEKMPWRERNIILKQQTGLLAKTWLSGLRTHTIGGIDVFDTLEHARHFALVDFPKVARELNAAFYVRVFDASVTESASRQVRSPYFV